MHIQKGAFFASLVAFVVITWAIGTAELDLDLYRILVLSLVGACVVAVIGMAIAGRRARRE